MRAYGVQRVNMHKLCLLHLQLSELVRQLWPAHGFCDPGCRLKTRRPAVRSPAEFSSLERKKAYRGATAALELARAPVATAPSIGHASLSQSWIGCPRVPVPSAPHGPTSWPSIRTDLYHLLSRLHQLPGQCSEFRMPSSGVIDAVPNRTPLQAPGHSSSVVHLLHCSAQVLARIRPAANLYTISIANSGSITRGCAVFACILQAR